MADRESRSLGLELITNPDEKAKIEAENALRQTRAAMDMLPVWMSERRPLLRPSLFLQLHGILMNRISQYPGVFRPGPMAITHSLHVPPPSQEVPKHVEDMCDYVNDNWTKKSAIHLSAYILWRTNWIHPFDDGNGRTARIVSYLILCAHTKTELPGVPTIPEQISTNKKPYYNSLEVSDGEFRRGKIDVFQLEGLLSACLAQQLVDFYNSAGGNSDGIDDITRKEIDDAIIDAQREGVITREAKAIFPKSKKSMLDEIEERPVFYGGLLTVALAIVGWLFAR